MKHISTIILISIVLGFLFFGYMAFVGKAMPGGYKNPLQRLLFPEDASQELQEQSLKAEEIKKQQKLLMEERERRMRENRSRY